MLEMRPWQVKAVEDIRRQQDLVSAAAREEVTEFDEIAATINPETIRPLRTHGDAVVLIKNRLVWDEGAQWIDNLAEAIIRRRDRLKLEDSCKKGSFGCRQNGQTASRT